MIRFTSDNVVKIVPKYCIRRKKGGESPVAPDAKTE
jgi:hypothetical protein